ncbi:MAG: hypothetical protein K2Y01_00090 [Rhabdochlamydiaceae bacterium]|nr:hypothetical protein [Rhabdochlamydiaceae bacterium]
MLSILTTRTTQQAFTIPGVPVLTLLVKDLIAELIIMTSAGHIKDLPENFKCGKRT